MIPHDSIPQSEVDANIDQFNSGYRRIRHTKECVGCADAQAASNYSGQLCDICNRAKIAEEGNR